MIYVKPSSSYKNAASDEPIFVLRAKDKLAPAVVRYWAMLALFNNYRVGSAIPIKKISDALACAIDMEIWGDSGGRSKWPD